MKLKSLLLSAALVVVTSCANQTEPFYVERFYPLNVNCVNTDPDEFISPNGYLDVAAGNPQFFIGMKITGAQKIEQEEVSVGATILERTDRNRPIINQQVINYRLSKRVGSTPKPYITNFNVPFSKEGAVFGPIQLISPELGAALFDGLAPSPGAAPSSIIEDFVDIQVDVEFKGEFSGSRAPFTTGMLTYPIRAYRSNPVACAAGDTFVPFAVTPAFESDQCRYAGQSSSQLIRPALPQCCGSITPSPSGC
ncbi:MAG: hypothetical protein Q8K32_36945 [Archangium sp.]|nr:hypothetical protein [Archangium sp.]